MQPDKKSLLAGNRSAGTLIFVCAMAMEAKGLLKIFQVKKRKMSGRLIVYDCLYKGREVVVIISGTGKLNAVNAARRIAEISRRGEIKAVLAVGLCGACDPSLRKGEPVIYGSIKNLSGSSEILECMDTLEAGSLNAANYKKVKGATIESLADSQEIKAYIYRNFGVQAVDMESYYICEKMKKIGVKTAVLRVISDTAQQELPKFMADFSENRKLSGAFRTAAAILNPVQARETVGLLNDMKRSLSCLTREVLKIIGN